MISTTSTNNSGRKLDICLFPETVGPGPVRLEVPGPVAKVTSGRIKASQNYVRLLLTPLGTWRSDPTAGSNFSSRFLSGIAFTFDQIPSFFAAESLSVIQFMANNRSANTPADERIVSATLLSYSVLTGSLTMSIQLAYADGAGTELTLPVKTGGMLN